MNEEVFFGYDLEHSHFDITFNLLILDHLSDNLIYNTTIKPSAIDERYTIAKHKTALHFKSTHTVSAIPRGRYFSISGNRNVYGSNIGINSRAEVDVRKLGWLKLVGGHIFYDEPAVISQFNAMAVNCNDNEFITTFGGVHNRSDLPVTLNHKYMGSVKSVIYNHAHSSVTVDLRNSIQRFKLTLWDENNLTIFTDVTSILANFSVTMKLDKFSNSLLVIRFKGKAVGRFIGMLHSANESETFSILLNDENIVPKIIAARLLCVKGATAFCLRGLWSSNVTCRTVKCITIDNEQVKNPDNVVSYEAGRKDSILDINTWGRYLNPKEWFDGITSSTEGIIIAVVIIISIIFIAILSCILRLLCFLYKTAKWCCCCCCCSFKSHKNQGTNV